MIEEIKKSFGKIKYIMEESFYLIRKHKLYALAPFLILMALLAFLFYHSGPAVVISFIYAGI